jgi:hypothetical protein
MSVQHLTDAFVRTRATERVAATVMATKPADNIEASVVRRVVDKNAGGVQISPMENSKHSPTTTEIGGRAANFGWRQVCSFIEVSNYESPTQA